MWPVHCSTWFLHASLSPETEFWTSSSKIGTIRLSFDIKLYFITNLVNRWHKNVSFCRKKGEKSHLLSKRLEVISKHFPAILTRMYYNNCWHSVLVSFLLTWHKLESFWKREPQLRKCPTRLACRQSLLAYILDGCAQCRPWADVIGMYKIAGCFFNPSTKEAQ